MDIAAYIDHTVLKPDTTLTDIERLCGEALTYRFAAVCVPPLYVKKATELLAGSAVKTATVIGFPFGYSAIEAKLAEVVLAIVDGADELDMVMNIAAVKNNDWQFIASEMNAILPVIRNKNRVLKVIIETGMLTTDEIIKCCTLYGAAGVDFLKTSTGYGGKGATVEAVRLMRQHLPPHVQIKASGGIRSFAFAAELLAAGASRIGCSGSIDIVHASGQKPV
ncbi:deoxyribose-phosphate aldolase [Agriterribacter sp.]|uniref:deoxyribose-phosphate aldolase n=1 Tax=Agriterribacter sp. TaxID=2821509 RepID=UPI002CB494FB|nr:deoxyribose-phosphate aldolase [Agriterribacter sp.]HRO45922.1 deoxyribose-phosphate aldolase [Agriterribacter sp.]HRQ18380.1 deoxyribose-phosphate aldolase [Agriterribacter sp.]